MTKKEQPIVKIFATHTIGSNNYVFENDIFKAVIKKNDSYIPKEYGGINLDINSAYCELTTQYWVWKNIDADYYGFIHYRRFLSFADKKIETNDWGNVIYDYISDDTLERIGVKNEDQVRKIVSKYDIIAPKHVDLEKTEFKSVYDHYKKAPKLHIEDLELMLSIIKKKAPKYYQCAKDYISGNKCYLCNIFVMKKELFDEYNNFLFTILQEFNCERDMSEYSTEAYRTPAHLGERLFGIFYTYIVSLGKYKTCEREMVYFKHTKQQLNLDPSFSENNVPIIFACSEYYAKFCSATIYSLIQNSSSDHNYDIIILCKDYSNNAKSRISSLASNRNNVSIRFYDVGMFFDSYSLYESPTIGIETYYRLVIPEVFNKYDKVLYLDCDLIVEDDVSKLFDIDIGNCFLGAVRDVTFQGNLNGGNDDFIIYYKKFGCKDYKNFFNAGVLIMNTKRIRENYSTRYLLDFAQQGAFKFQDQDLLNILFEGEIFELDYKWNFFGDPDENMYRSWINTFAPKDSYKKYIEARKDFSIIHYAGNEKPWWDPKQQYAEYFWKYFRETPYYEEFLIDRMHDISIFNDNRRDKKVEIKSEPPKGKFLRLLPRGSKRREVAKKIAYFFMGKSKGKK